MKRFGLVALIAFPAWASCAHAEDDWACSFVSPHDRMPVQVSYKVVGEELVETFPAGLQDRYKLVQNNAYGLISISWISGIERDQALRR